MPQRPVDKTQALQRQGPGQTEAMLGGGARPEDAGRQARVSSIPISQIVPDYYQPRVILPPKIKTLYYGGQISIYQAARMLLNAAEQDPGIAREVASLLALGESILSDEQISSATGKWMQTPAGPRFLLETGERRMWSLAIAYIQTGNSETPSSDEEPRLKVIERKEISRVRQVAENVQREDISAVDLAKAIASLILLHLGISPDKDEPDNDYFRRVLEIKKLPNGTWEEVQKVISYERTYLGKHLQLLALDDESLYKASQYRLPEGLLRGIISAPRSDQPALIDEAIRRILANEDTNPPEPERPGKAEPRPSLDLATRSAKQVRSLYKLIMRDPSKRSIRETAIRFATMTKDPENDLDTAAEYLTLIADELRDIRSKRFSNK